MVGATSSQCSSDDESRGLDLSVPGVEAYKLWRVGAEYDGRELHCCYSR